MCLLPATKESVLKGSAVHVTTAGDSRPLDPAHIGMVAPFGRQPTLTEWSEWWRQCRLVPPGAWEGIRGVRRAVYTVCGIPITHLTHHGGIRGKKVEGYPPGVTFYYDQLPGLGDPSFRLDILTWTTSFALIPHEIAHTLNDYVLRSPTGRPSDTVEWDRIHRSTAWGDWTTATNKHEAWAEGFAMHSICRHEGPDYIGMNHGVWVYFNELRKRLGWNDW